MCIFLRVPKSQAPIVDRGARDPNPHGPRSTPLATRYFETVSINDEVLGDVQILFARHENTLAGLARQYNLGYQALRQANPTVDPWLPGEGTPIVLPTMSVVPEASRDGIVINLPTLRLLYFVAESTDDDGQTLQNVTSHPIGIGREGWATPTGSTYITEKTRQPNWYPPASVRAEHAKLGNPLPAMVPPGPHNPLGHFKMRLSTPGYLIHGTNKPSGVGMRVSHGCIRLYPEDIKALFDRVPPRTPVSIVNQPVLAGWRKGVLYLEVHPQLAEDERDLESETRRVIGAALLRASIDKAALDHRAITKSVTQRRGIPLPVSGHTLSFEQYLAKSRIIENILPEGETVEPVI